MINELEDFIGSLPKADEKTFKPSVFHNKAGDCLEFYASPESFFAERLDGFITLYIGRETGDIVGCVLKGVSTQLTEMFEKYPGLKLEISGKRIKLAPIFTFRQFTSSSKQVAEAYRSLRIMAETPEIEEDLDEHLCCN